MREPPAYQEYASDILATEWYKNMPLETRRYQSSVQNYGDTPLPGSCVSM
jgi:hypothetical protein